MTQANENIRYEPDGRSPHLISAGLGFQITAITLAPVAVTVVIIARAADQPENYIAWAVFAAVVVSGVEGFRIVARDGMDPRNAMVVGCHSGWVWASRTRSSSPTCGLGRWARFSATA